MAICFVQNTYLHLLKNIWFVFLDFNSNVSLQKILLVVTIENLGRGK